MSSKRISRNQSQRQVVAVLYDYLTRLTLDESIDVYELLENSVATPFEDIDIYIKEVVIKAIKNHHQIVSLLETKMTSWTFARLNRLAQAILLLSVSHYRYVGDVDKKVVIDVAVRLAKLYLDKDEYKYINALLDNVL
ncbi:MAG: transcription antitermination protein NusB [Bacilli bacterium]|jgi:transcription termination factor NusB|nr:transcription antitermination protein NusB [Bacilli bacterium]NLN80483.1 transcription antitermination protein NusB [Erysipelotrichia bacterium]